MTVAARRNRVLLAVLVALSMTAAIVGVAVLTGRSAQAAATVFLEPRDAVGENPFLPLDFPTGESDQATPIPDAAGTGDQATCDPATLTAYLTGHPAAAAAWVAALDADLGLRWSGGDSITVEQIPAYVAELTPAVLGGDMQVTNHRFVDGQLAAVQSVLQEGTAVLIDSAGTPRVRCACGNPLTPAAEWDDESDGTDPRYVGESWDGFSHDEDAEEHADTAAYEDEDATNDHPVVDCKRDEYRDGDQCVKKDCPRGSYRDDHGRCQPPVTHCDPDALDRCTPHPGCRPPGPAENEAAATEKRGKPCPPPPCEDGQAIASRTAGGDGCAPPPCTAGAEAAAAGTKPCTEPIPSVECATPASERTATTTDTSTGTCPPPTVCTDPDPTICPPASQKRAAGAEGGPAAKVVPPASTLIDDPAVRNAVPPTPPVSDTVVAPTTTTATTAPTTTAAPTTTTTAPTTPTAAVEPSTVAKTVPAPVVESVPSLVPRIVKIVICPNRKPMRAVGCAIPAKGVPAGWVARPLTKRMVPAVAGP